MMLYSIQLYNLFNDPIIHSVIESIQLYNPFNKSLPFFIVDFSSYELVFAET